MHENKPQIALVHDYITQRGGAERVVLAMARALNCTKITTSLYNPRTTFPEFRQYSIVTSGLNRLRLFRENHRLAAPLLAPVFANIRIEADVTICSSSGWAHGVGASGRKIVYCYTPARWLYQSHEYMGSSRRAVMQAALTLAAPTLRSWDRRAAASADRYLAISTAVRDRIWRTYGIDSQVLPAPFGVDPKTELAPIENLEPGFVLCVARLLPYKNVDKVIAAIASTPHRLVVVGDGPERGRLSRLALPNVTMLRGLTDQQLCWLLANCSVAVSASYEDFGLLPLEAGIFGRPAAVLKWGGFLDTVIDGRTGTFFDSPEPSEIRSAIDLAMSAGFDSGAIRRHAENYSPDAFARNLRSSIQSLP